MTKKLLAFFSIGLFIFILDILFEDFSDDKTIVIFDSELKGLLDTWTNQVGREPNEQELSAIINQLVDEEILYREALNLGLDKNDIIIKRRLAQKIGFLKQEEVEPLTNKEIEEFFNNNKPNYLVPKQYTFTHIYFNTDRDGNNRALKAFKDWKEIGELPYGDPFLLGKNFSLKTSKEVARAFGENFAEEIKKVSVNNWFGPLKSSYGSHLVFINSVVEERMPELKEVRVQLISDLQLKQKEDDFRVYLDNLREKYKVQVNSNLVN
ncbi:MAG: peptidylprolyl isomerase [Gammaproteobacteria bacterium]